MTSMEELLGIPAWHEKAICRGAGWDKYFLKRGTSHEVYDQLRDTCSGCPVRMNCLESGVTHNDKFGIWGGFGEAQRSWIRKRLGLVDVETPDHHLSPELWDQMVQLVAEADDREAKRRAGQPCKELKKAA